MPHPFLEASNEYQAAQARFWQKQRPSLKMRGLYFDGQKVSLREDLPVPYAQANQSILKVELAGLCNTDKEVAKGYKAGFTGILGHEVIGTVLFSEQANLIGQTVAVEINGACGTCQYCEANLPNHCSFGRVLGMYRQDGCFAEFLAFDDCLLHPVPKNLPLESAIFTEPLAAALELGERADLKPSYKIGIIGDGRLALMMAQVLSLRGNLLTVIGRHPEKWDLFKPYAECKLLADCTNESYDCVIDACGNQAGLQTALQLVKRRGLIIVKSTYAGEVKLDFNQIVVNELTLSGNRCGPFQPALNLLAKQFVKLPKIKLYDVANYEAAFKDPAFKVVFDFRD